MNRKGWNKPYLSGTAELLFEEIKELPILSPHGHCDPSWFAKNELFSDPAELLIVPDHYIFRMLYSKGVSLPDLGVGVKRGRRNPREIFKILARNWHLFLGTPSRQWLDYTFKNILQIDDSLSEETADRVYDKIDACLKSEDFRPRMLFDQFGVELLATTDTAVDQLNHHREISASAWQGRVVPTFRPDSVLNPKHAHFKRDVMRLGEICNCDISSYQGYITALCTRRAEFIELGATASDHDVPELAMEWLDTSEIERLFGLAIGETIEPGDAVRFYGHMLIEMAQMSIEDGLTMQLHVGSVRSTNYELCDQFGPDIGADIPKRIEWTTGMLGLLNRVGNNPKLTIIAFTLDESSYSRELAPMAGHWPALRLGPPWWFHDSLNGIRRYFDEVVETAGYWNLSGFNDDTRAFLSIPARHDLWRRGVSLHLAEQVEKDIMNKEDAKHVAKALTYDLVVDSYKLGAS